MHYRQKDIVFLTTLKQSIQKMWSTINYHHIYTFPFSVAYLTLLLDRFFPSHLLYKALTKFLYLSEDIGHSSFGDVVMFHVISCQGSEKEMIILGHCPLSQPPQDFVCNTMQHMPVNR